MPHAVSVTLAALAVGGQAACAALLVAGLLALAGRPALLGLARSWLWGYELWLVFLIAATTTGGSLFFSEIAGYVPCELCWFQRICMYPLSIIALLAALADDHRIARYLLPLPIVGAGLAGYQLLVENGVVTQSQACSVSAPGGCATKWIEEFGYMTIPGMALTGSVLAFALLLFATFESGAAAEEAR